MLNLFLNISFKSTLFQKCINPNLLQIRTKMKSHKAITSRIIKRTSGLKRKHAGLNHGLGRFSTPSLKHLRGMTTVKKEGGYLKKMYPYA